MTDFFPGAAQKSDVETTGRTDRVLVPFIRLGEQLRQAKAADSPDENREILIKTIEGEIIPRLMLTLKDAREKETAEAVGVVSPTEEERTRFLWTIMNGSSASSRQFVSGLIARGVSREAVYLDLLTGAARRLGEMWERDDADFTDVTIGLCRLHQILREQSAQASVDWSGGKAAPSIVLATCGEDQHVFGVIMVSEFFRRAGWRVWSEPAAPLGDLSTLVANEWFDAIGLSASCEAPAERISTEIETLRRASKNPGVVVLVGGGLFNNNPDLVSRVGADATAADGKAAVEISRKLVVTALQQG
ncbi:MAG: B12-binding domain-containing protein [Parvularculaceae bacterium]